MRFAKTIDEKNDDPDKEARELICAAYKEIILKEILEKYYTRVKEKSEELSKKYNDFRFDYNDKYREIYFWLIKKHENYDLRFTYIVYKPDSSKNKQRRPVVGMQVFQDDKKVMLNNDQDLCSELKKCYMITDNRHIINWFDTDWFSDYIFDQRDNFKKIDNKIFELFDDKK